VVLDLIDRLGSATVFGETTLVEPGNPDHRSLLQEGWARPEVHGDSGRTFAWVTAPEARVEIVRLHAGAGELVVRGWPFRWPEAPAQELEIRVNGQSVGSRPMKRGRSAMRFDVPEGVFCPGTNSIDLRFGYADSPANVSPGSQDGRSLAAAIERIEIRGSHRRSESSIPPVPRPEASGGVSLPPDTAVSYRLLPSGEIALDLEATPATDPVGTSPRLVVWLKPAGREPQVMIDEVISKSGLRRRVWLPNLSGRLVDIGISVTGGGVTVGRAQLVGTGGVDPVKNLLMIVIDTLRADYVGAYGGPAETPSIDGFAADGVLFERAYVHIPITGPSHSSLFTSLLPFEHGVHNNGQVLPESWTTLAETLRDNGWRTAGIVSLGVLKREFGYRRGFEIYMDTFERDWMKNAREVTDEAVGIIEGGLSAPYFLFVHYSDPHEPYTPPGLDYPKADVLLGDRLIGEVVADGRGNRFEFEVEPGRHPLRFVLHRPQPKEIFRVGTFTVRGKDVELIVPRNWEVQDPQSNAPTYGSRLPAALELINSERETRKVRLHFTFKRRLEISEVIERYIQEVEFADAQIGRLLAELERRGQLDETLIVFSSDHGEGLGQHNHLAHIHQVYDTLIRVPLIVVDPRTSHAGTRVSHRVAWVDLFPTIAEMLGVDPPSPSSGTSLAPLLRGDPMAPRPVFAETRRPDAFTDKRAIISGNFKFIHSWSDGREWEELYDLETDPGELHDLVSQRPDVSDELRRALYDRLRMALRGRADEAELSPDDLDRLQALGYVR